MDAYGELIRLLDEKRKEEREYNNARWEETKKFFREVKEHGRIKVKVAHEQVRG